MLDLLLILPAVGILVAAYLLRTLLGLRMPEVTHLKKARLHRPPDIMVELFNEVDRTLGGLGFEHVCWATVQTVPPLPGLAPPLARLYRHPQHPVIARVTPPHGLFSADHCAVIFLSIDTKRCFLATTRRVPEFLPPLPETLALQINADVGTLAEQFQAHILEMARQKGKWQARQEKKRRWLDRSEKKGACPWALALINRFEKKSTQWSIEQSHVVAMPEGGLTPTTANVVRFAWEFFTGRQHRPAPERDPLPPGRAAYLFRNWRRTSRLPLPLPAQLWPFLASTLLFSVVVGFYWGWHFALLLFFVIPLHESGHWLAMRLQGYRNLQIPMLPLIGGVTADREPQPRARDRAITSLMGPLPGIFAGWALLWIFGVAHGWISDLGILLLTVNYLSLLPVTPLDGGQMLKALVPPQRFHLLIGIELLGTAGLFYLAGSSDAPGLAVLVLIPLLGVLGRMRKRRILSEMRDSLIVPGEKPSSAQIEAVVASLDRTRKRYRPLMKKVREIDEILTTLRSLPVAPRLAGILLTLYSACFVVLPILAYAASPSIQAAANLLHPGKGMEPDATHPREMALPMDQLLAELAEAHGKTDQRSGAQPAQMILFPSASEQTITGAERRLGIHLADDYREFLAASNGFVHEWSPHNKNNHYRLLPVEQVDILERAIPGLVPQLRAGLEARDGKEAQAETRLDPETLRNTLLIGMKSLSEYLLLETHTQADGGTALLVIDERLHVTRYPGLRAYLANELAGFQVPD